jgi:hypothetical protein
MTDPLRVLIVGGYGTFGGRLVDLLQDEPRLVLIVSGRSLLKATAFCQARPAAAASLVPYAFARDASLLPQLASIKPDILVDASGPFQAYGEGPYRVIEACNAQGINYLDLADSGTFVAGVEAYDHAALAAGLYVISGLSTCPALSAAIVRHLSADLAEVHGIRAGIAPSPFAGVGENVIRAIASYAGREIPLKHGGAMGSGHAFTDQTRFTIAPPGHVPLHSRLFSLVDVPDLRVMPDLWPEVRQVWVGAAPVPALLHRFLIALAWLVRLGVLPSLSGLAGLMHRATCRLRWGEHRGGMFVEVDGTDQAGGAQRRSWHLVAEEDSGPLIPSMAVAALIGKILEGQELPAGARSAARELELADYERLFAGRAIHAGMRDDTSWAPRPLYARLLGDAWHDLPAEIRTMHESAVAAEGRGSVGRGKSFLARMAAAIIGFPMAAADTPVRVRFETVAGVEKWTRNFGGQTFSSRQFAGRGRSNRLLCERFGPLTFAMALVVDGPRLRLVLRRWKAFGIALPTWLCPRSDSYESVEDGRFRFHVDISHPITGPIVRYRGWLAPIQK